MKLFHITCSMLESLMQYEKYLPTIGGKVLKFYVNHSGIFLLQRYLPNEKNLLRVIFSRVSKPNSFASLQILTPVHMSVQSLVNSRFFLYYLCIHVMHEKKLIC